jgi:hypothetical protein
VVIDGLPGEVAGPFATFPVPGTTPAGFSFGFGSCQQSVVDDASWDGAIWAHVDAADLAFFLHTGDWGYPDQAYEQDNPVPPYFYQVPGQLEESYKVRYDTVYPMHEIFDTVPIAYVYDDHDFAADNSDGSYPDTELNVQAYLDYFPGYPVVDPDLGIYHSFQYGNCEFFMLDSRTQRDPNIFGFPNFMDWLNDPTVPLFYAPDPVTHRFLGEDQVQWLLDGLAASTATWKFVVSPVSWNPGLRAGIELALALQGTEFDPIDTPEGTYSAAQIAVAFSDAGAGFPVEMAEIRGFTAANAIENVILLSGDLHTACLDDGANSPFPEWMASTLDRTNSQVVALLEQFGIFTWNGQGQHANQTNFDVHYGKVSVNGDESVTVELIDTEGNVFATDTLTPGFVPSPVNMTVGPQGAVFSDVPIYETALWPIFVINTGADDLMVNHLIGLEAPFQVVGLTPDFQVDPDFTLPFSVPAGQKQILAALFTPLEAGTYADTLAVISNDPDGPVGVVLFGTAVDEVGVEEPELPGDTTPLALVLEQNHPNPFNPTTTIAFTVPRSGRVNLTVFDLRGRRVRTLLDAEIEAGRHEVVLDGRELASGTYVYRLTGDTFVRTQKMQLVK